MFPDVSSAKIESVMEIAISWEEAVELLTSSKDPSSGCELIKSFISEKLVSSKHKLLEIKREEIWREALRFYKIAMVDKTVIFQKLVVEFSNELGVDAGALCIEYFTKFFDVVRKELFEVTPSEMFLIPRRSGGNLTLFKLFGIAVAHSLVQGGPPFPYFPPWCYAMIAQKSEEEVVALISTCDYNQLIPLNAGTATVLSFLKLLTSVQSDSDIDNLFDSTEGQAYEQVVNSSQWPIDTKICLANVEALKSMVIWEELVVKREKQISAIREGLAYTELLPLIKKYSLLLSEYFIGSGISLNYERFKNIIQWNTVTSTEYQYVLDFFNQYIEESGSEELAALLKFSTGYSIVTTLNDIKISLE